MAKFNESLYYEPPPDAVTVRLRGLDERRLEDVLDFCDHVDQKGMYDWNPLDADDEEDDADFYFTDPNTAFAFKMRFG